METSQELIDDISKFGNDIFDNAPTWDDLARQIALMTPGQRSNKVTVELDFTDECIPACLDITGEDHDSLDADIAVLRIQW